MIAGAIPIYIALERVDLRMGSERLGGWVRERMAMEPRSRALFVFVGKRGHTMKIWTWDGTGTVMTTKRLDVGCFELPRAADAGQHHVVVSDALFRAIYQGSGVKTKPRPRRTH
jgi:transposase